MTRCATLLIQQCNEEMRRLNVLAVTTNRQRLGVGQCQLELACQFIHAHKKLSPLRQHNHDGD
jgi:hypothetical protein